MIEKKAHVVFADDDAKSGVTVEMITPVVGGESVGGYMGCSLEGIVIDDKYHSTNEYTRHIQEKNPSVEVDRPILVIDTGAQSYFLRDDTGHSPEDVGFLDYIGYTASVGDDTGMYGLVLVNDAGECFEVLVPRQWRPRRSTQSLAAAKPDRPTTMKRSNILFVGNLFLQSIAVTFNCKSETITFCHLDGLGRRVRSSRVPDSMEPPKKNFSELLRVDTDRSGWSSDGYEGARLGKSLVAGALAPGEVPEKNKKIDIVLTKDVKSDGTWRSVPTIDPDDIVHFCVPVRINGEDVNFVLDTGSGVCLTTVAGIEIDPGGAKQCEVRRIDETLDIACSGECSACCEKCCLVDGVSPEDELGCYIKYCTGTVEYTPGFYNIQIDKSGPIHSYLAKARALCDSTRDATEKSIMGCWRWNFAEKNKLMSTCLPFYVTRHMGQGGTDLDNMTIAVYRSDLLGAPTKRPNFCGKLSVPPERGLSHRGRVRLIAIAATFVALLLAVLLL